MNLKSKFTENQRYNNEFIFEIKIDRILYHYHSFWDTLLFQVDPHKWDLSARQIRVRTSTRVVCLKYMVGAKCL